MGRKSKPPRLEKSADGTWYVHWSEDGRSKRQSLRTTDLQKAQSRFSGWLDAKHVDESSDVPTVEFCWNLYMEDRRKNVKVISILEMAGRYLMPHFGKMRVHQITAEDIDSYMRKRNGSHALRSPASDGTIRIELSKLRACLAFMQKKVTPLTLRLSNKHVPYIHMPGEQPPRSRVVLADEQQRMLLAAKTPEGQRMTRLERFLWIAFETGARRQAILDLTWDRVNFEHGTINFLPHGERQTNKRRPTAPISERLMPVLRRAYSERENEYVMDKRDNIHGILDYFVNKHGFQGVTAHTIRHSVATQMAMAGVPMNAIAAILGDSITTVMKNYLHMQPDWLRGAMTMRYTPQNDALNTQNVSIPCPQTADKAHPEPAKSLC